MRVLKKAVLKKPSSPKARRRGTCRAFVLARSAAQGISSLVAAAVKEPTWGMYVMMLNIRLQFAGQHFLPMDTPAGMDAAMVARFNQAFADGEEISFAQRVYASWKAHHPEYGEAVPPSLREAREL